MIKLKNLVNEAALKESVVGEEDQDYDFKRGYALGKKDYIQEYERDLDPNHLSPAFLKGYKKGWAEERRKRWWDKFNNKMTDLLGRMGSSRLR